MKRSLILCSLIMIVAALLGWRENRQLSSEQEANAELVKEAAAIRGEDAQSRQSPALREGRKDRRNEDLARKAAAKALVNDYFALYRDYEANPNGKSSEEFEEMKAAVQNRIYALGPMGFEDFIAGFSNNPDLTPRMKRAIQSMAIDFFNRKYPLEMAAILSRSPEMFKTKPDPTYQENTRDPFFNLIFHCRNELKDTRLALQCIAAAEPEYQEKYISAVIMDACNSQERDRLLEEMREFATTPEQVALVSNTLSQLAFGPDYAKLTFKEVSDWLGSANLSGEELVGATRDMQNKVRVGETGQWLDWLAKSGVPHEVSKERAFELASAWTEADYLAAGKWLNSAPDSPEKSAVASAFAAKAYPYDPEGAMKWIQTLPQGADRTKALETIYQGMPKDSDAANAFARDFGLRK